MPPPRRAGRASGGRRRTASRRPLRQRRAQLRTVEALARVEIRPLAAVRARRGERVTRAAALSREQPATLGDGGRPRRRRRSGTARDEQRRDSREHRSHDPCARRGRHERHCSGRPEGTSWRSWERPCVERDSPSVASGSRVMPAGSSPEAALCVTTLSEKPAPASGDFRTRPRIRTSDLRFRSEGSRVQAQKSWERAITTLGALVERVFARSGRCLG